MEKQPAYRPTRITEYSRERARALAGPQKPVFKAEAASRTQQQATHMADIAKLLGSTAPKASESLANLLRKQLNSAKQRERDEVMALAASVQNLPARNAQPAPDSIKKFIGFDLTIQKLDSENRTISGYASRTSLDSQGERVTTEALKGALPDYLKFPTLREMHSNTAAGTVTAAKVDSTGLHIVAKVVDDAAWKKVQAGVYRGFSIGGKSITKAAGVISKMRLTEISLVDRPANVECMIDATATSKA